MNARWEFLTVTFKDGDTRELIIGPIYDDETQLDETQLGE
jgi:hypothetical protein